MLITIVFNQYSVYNNILYEIYSILNNLNKVNICICFNNSNPSQI